MNIEAAGSAERLSRRLDQLDTVPLTEARSQIVRRSLIVIHPHEVQVRLMVDAVLLKPKHHPTHDVIRVRTKTKDRVDRGNPFGTLSGRALLGLTDLAAEERGGQRDGKSGRKERSA